MRGFWRRLIESHRRYQRRLAQLGTCGWKSDLAFVVKHLLPAPAMGLVLALWLGYPAGLPVGLISLVCILLIALPKAFQIDVRQRGE